MSWPDRPPHLMYYIDVLQIRTYILQKIYLQRSGYVPEQSEWERKAANLLKAELKRKGVTYVQLVERLAGIGITEKEANVRNKLSRGKFSAAFMLACLNAIGCTTFYL